VAVNGDAALPPSSYTIKLLDPGRALDVLEEIVKPSPRGAGKPPQKEKKSLIKFGKL